MSGHLLAKMYNLLMNELIILTAKYLFLANILIWGIYLLRLPRKQWLSFGIFSVAAAAVALALGKIGNTFINDPRPFVTDNVTPLLAHAADNGFPSDHTLITALFAAVVFSRNKKLGSVMLLIALAVGASRVAAHVHHLLDIAGSFVIAVVAVVIVWFVERQLKMSRSKPNSGSTE